MAIDDDPTILDIIGLYLEDYNVVKITNHNDLLEFLSENKGINVFLSDIVIVGGNDEDVFNSVKEYNKLATIIGISGHSSVKKNSDVLELGFSDYFIKPVKFEDLNKTVRFHLSKHKRWNLPIKD